MITIKVNNRGETIYGEARIALGPAAIGTTGNGTYNDLFGYAWAAYVYDSGKFAIAQAKNADGSPWQVGTATDSASWVEVQGVSLPVPQSPKHIGFAFDQAANPVVAYEDGTKQVYVVQWDQLSLSYIVRGSFPGVDPVLINDATVNYYSPDSDVLLLHLSADRRSLIMRVQREQYATEHTIDTFTSDAYLDQAIALPYQLEVVGSLSDDLFATGLVYRSDMYPVRNTESMTPVATAVPASGELHPVVIISTLPQELLSSIGASVPTSGDFQSIIVKSTPPQETLDSINAGVPATASWASNNVTQTLPQETLSIINAALAASGSYVQSVAAYTAPADTFASVSASVPTGGSYV